MHNQFEEKNLRQTQARSQSDQLLLKEIQELRNKQLNVE